MPNTGKDASGNTIFLWLPFGETGVDNTNAYGYGSIVGFNRNTVKQVPLLDTSTPANNRPFPIVNLAGDGLAPFDVNSGGAGATTLRTVLATRHEAAATPLSFRLTNGSAFVDTIPVTSNGYVSTATVTRGANTTAYTANDVIGSVLTFANIGSSAGHVILTSVDVLLNITAVPSGMGNLILYLYEASPPSAFTDNGSFSLPTGDRATILTPGGINLGTPVVANGGGTVVLQATNLNLQLKLASASTSLFGYLVTPNAFTPAANSETYTVRLRSIGV